MSREESYSIRSVVKAFRVFEEFFKKRELGVSELSNLTLLSKNNVFRVLATLCKLGYIEKLETGEYRLSNKFIRFLSGLSDEFNIAKLAEKYLIEITKACNETSYIAVPSGEHIIFVAQVESSNDLRVKREMFKPYNIESDAAGLLLRMTRDKIIDEIGYKTAIADGIFSISSVFTGKDGKAIGAVSVGIPDSRISAVTEAKISHLVIEAAKKITENIF